MNNLTRRGAASVKGAAPLSYKVICPVCGRIMDGIVLGEGEYVVGLCHKRNRHSTCRIAVRVTPTGYKALRMPDTLPLERAGELF